MVDVNDVNVLKLIKFWFQIITLVYIQLNSIKIIMSSVVNILGNDCDISTATHIDLSVKKLNYIPDSISLLMNLQVLNLHNNNIADIPD